MRRRPQWTVLRTHLFKKHCVRSSVLALSLPSHIAFRPSLTATRFWCWITVELWSTIVLQYFCRTNLLTSQSWSWSIQLSSQRTKPFDFKFRVQKFSNVRRHLFWNPQKCQPSCTGLLTMSIEGNFNLHSNHCSRKVIFFNIQVQGVLSVKVVLKPDEYVRLTQCTTVD
ncbi:hypothetical protein M758_1G176800 [Ceratodon purpureus]|nr:hypothetical protein M758_1G176800 [Ceratodon purpureus]